jgi:hypothetical protein
VGPTACGFRASATSTRAHSWQPVRKSLELLSCPIAGESGVVHLSYQFACPRQSESLVRIVPGRCRPEHPWDPPETVRTSGDDPLYLDDA